MVHLKFHLKLTNFCNTGSLNEYLPSWKIQKIYNENSKFMSEDEAAKASKDYCKVPK